MSSFFFPHCESIYFSLISAGWKYICINQWRIIDKIQWKRYYLLRSDLNVLRRVRREALIYLGLEKSWQKSVICRWVHGEPKSYLPSIKIVFKEISIQWLLKTRNILKGRFSLLLQEVKTKDYWFRIIRPKVLLWSTID